MIEPPKKGRRIYDIWRGLAPSFIGAEKARARAMLGPSRVLARMASTFSYSKRSG
jgi:hypothetical protein